MNISPTTTNQVPFGPTITMTSKVHATGEYNDTLQRHDYTTEIATVAVPTKVNVDRDLVSKSCPSKRQRENDDSDCNISNAHGGSDNQRDEPQSADVVDDTNFPAHYEDHNGIRNEDVSVCVCVCVM